MKKGPTCCISHGQELLLNLAYTNLVMSLIPILTARQMLSILLRTGFKILHQKGSHIRLKNLVTRKVTTIPMHTGDLTRKLMTKILKQSGLSLREILRLK